MSLATASRVTPFAAAKSCGVQQPRARSAAVVRCTAISKDEAALASRREAVLRFASLPALFAAAPALALIPDDADEELIEKLAASRKNRLAQEKSVEKDFVRAEGYVDRATEKELVPVQRAVNKLAKSGVELEQGNIKEAAATLGDGWMRSFEKAGRDLSGSATAQASLGTALDAMKVLQKAASGGDLAGAKGGFVSTVDALAAWVADAGIADTIVGI